MTKIFLRRTYKNTITGLGITEVALGCSIFCLSLGSAGVSTSQSTTFPFTLYAVLSLITSLCLITSGAICIESAKKETTCYIFLTLVLSTLTTLLTATFLGFQVLYTAEYVDRGSTNAYTLTALLLECIFIATCFLLCFTSIALTCTAGGACGKQTEVRSTQVHLVAVLGGGKPQNGTKPVVNGYSKNGGTEARKNGGSLPLHESRPNTAHVNEYWNGTQQHDTNGKKIFYAEDV